MGEVLLLRHGRTEWSLNGRHTGRTDIPLLPEGERDARALRPWLDTRNVIAAFTSPLQRAARTAELADVQATVDADLREWDYGDYEGITTKAIRESVPEWYLFRDGCPNGESPEQAGRRVDRVLDKVRPMLVDGDVALFAHGHILRVLAARWLQLSPSGGGLLRLDTGTTSVLGFEHGRPAIHVWNASIVLAEKAVEQATEQGQRTP
jgi:broad specificity phosphatase PhoE